MGTYSFMAAQQGLAPQQTTTIGQAGTYDISAFGAQGGRTAGGLGASTEAYFDLTAGTRLRIVVGGQGSDGSNGGGGGGSFVLASTNGGASYSLLLASGGGGGSGGFTNNPTTGRGGYSALDPRGSGNGLGGAGGDAGGGAGFNGPGNNGGSGFGATSYRGFGQQGNFAGVGGVGGGGGGGNNASGGGGGGFTGGFGGSGGGGAGGGGFSYISNDGTPIGAQTVAANHTGNGQVTVTFVRAAAVPPPANNNPGPCYVTGTRIRVLAGSIIRDVPVEALRVGDLALTASGQPRPIRWIGSRSYPGLTAPRHDHPLRIRAGALADGLPARDLLVSPDHCLMVDGLFVAAGHLSNGTSIVRGEAVRDLTYWHVELDTHDLLLAENTPAESFLAAPGVRTGFDDVGADDVGADDVGADDAAAAPVAYAPRAERHTPEMDALRERLIRRAGLSVEPLRFGAVRAWLDVCDGTRIAGWARDDAHPDAPVCLDVLVDGEVVALALAQDYRHDLAAAGMGDGRHGFDIALDAPPAPGVAHTVEVRRSGDGLRVAAMAVDAAGAWTALLAA